MRAVHSLMALLLVNQGGLHFLSLELELASMD